MAWLARLLAVFGVVCLFLSFTVITMVSSTINQQLFAAAVALFILSATMWVIELRSRAER